MKTFSTTSKLGTMLILCLFLLSSKENAVFAQSDHEPYSSQFIAMFEGLWDAPMEMGSTMNFVYEFTYTNEGEWSGRWKNKKKNIWVDIKGLSVTPDGISFYFESQPERIYVNLTFEDNGAIMSGGGELREMGVTIPITAVKAE